MHRFLIAASLAAFVAAVLPARAQTPPAAPPPPPAGPIHVVVYVEINPDASKESVKALRAYRAGTGRESGAVSVDLYRETGMKNRFVINEVWKDFSSYDAHAKASKLAEGMKAGSFAPPDTRTHTAYAIGSAGPARAGDKSLHAFTHVDVPPPRQAELEALYKPLIEKSRAEAGAVRFDMAQSPARPNHFTLIEGWDSAAAMQAHAASAHAREFREKLSPILGALYDHRVYKLMK